MPAWVTSVFMIPTSPMHIRVNSMVDIRTLRIANPRSVLRQVAGLIAEAPLVFGSRDLLRVRYLQALRLEARVPLDDEAGRGDLASDGLVGRPGGGIRPRRRRERRRNIAVHSHRLSRLVPPEVDDGLPV